jgi:hypothetical protein
MTDGSVVLDIDELRRALTRCLDAYERHHGPQLTLDASMYWLVDPGAAFAMDAVPELGVGDLVDDLAEMEALAQQTHDVIEPLLWHSLGHLLGPLTRLASMR